MAPESAASDSDQRIESFEDAISEMRTAARLEPSSEKWCNPLLPESGYDAETVLGTTVWAGSPSTALLYAAINQPAADEVEGIKPTRAPVRRPQSVLFEPAFGPNDEDDTEDEQFIFQVVERFVDSFDTDRAVVQTPAPWDVPDDLDAPNEIVKSLEWEEHHRTFDEDREAWVLDETGLEPLQDRAVDAGYQWEDRTVDDSAQQDEEEEEDSSDRDAFDRLLQLVEEGDRLSVRYRQKNGNGIGCKSGTVTVVQVREGEFGDQTAGIVIRRADDTYNRVKRDDNGTPAVFSSSQYPFMGELVSAEVKPVAE
jgi:hypothetical protein